MEYITLKERTSLKRFGIRTEDGKDTGEYIEIDLEDIELPIKANNCQLAHVGNFQKLKEKLDAINKQEDIQKENEFLSENKKASLEAFKKFYEAEENAIDLFLGEGATRKLLNGRNPYLTMYDDINEYLEQIIPTLKDTQKSIIDGIENKYKTEKEDNIL